MNKFDNWVLLLFITIFIAIAYQFTQLDFAAAHEGLKQFFAERIFL